MISLLDSKRKFKSALFVVFIILWGRTYILWVIAHSICSFVFNLFQVPLMPRWFLTELDELNDLLHPILKMEHYPRVWERY